MLTRSALPSRIGKPVVQAAADACKCAGDRGGQQVPLLIGEDGKTDFGAEALHDADDQRAADAPTGCPW